MRCVYLEGTILISGDLVIPVTVAVQRSEHDAERAGPLTEEDEEVMPQALLWKQEASVVHWGMTKKKPLYGTNHLRTAESGILFVSFQILTTQSAFSNKIVKSWCPWGDR